MIRLFPEELSDYIKYIPNKHTSDSIIGYTLTLDENKEWDLIQYYCKSWMAYDKGFVYILNNPSIPNILKIGFTNKNVEERVKEISSATGVIIPYELLFVYECKNAYGLEQKIHKELESLGYRVNSRREGFNIELEKAIKLIEYFGEEFKGKTLINKALC